MVRRRRGVGRGRLQDGSRRGIGSWLRAATAVVRARARTICGSGAGAGCAVLFAIGEGDRGGASGSRIGQRRAQSVSRCAGIGGVSVTRGRAVPAMCVLRKIVSGASSFGATLRCELVLKGRQSESRA